MAGHFDILSFFYILFVIQQPIVSLLSSRGQNAGLSRSMRDGWQLWSIRSNTVYNIHSNVLIALGSTSDPGIVAAVMIQNKPITKIVRLTFYPGIAAAVLIQNKPITKIVKLHAYFFIRNLGRGLGPKVS